MKNKYSIPTIRVLLLITLVSIKNFALSQNLTTEKKIIATETGKLDLKNGEKTVYLNPNIFLSIRQPENENSDYDIFLKPIGTCGELRIKYKDNNKFIVESISNYVNKNEEKQSFNYIILVRSTDNEKVIKLATNISTQ